MPTVRATILLSSLLLAAPFAHGATVHADRFDATNNLLGWAGGSVPTWVAGGGPGGGSDSYLQISSSGPNLAVRNSMPAWTGGYEFLAAGEVVLAVDLRAPTQSAPLAIRAVLFGPDANADRFVSSVAAQVPSDGVWRRYRFSLRESDLVRVQGTISYAQLLGNVGRVMLRHDPNGPSAGGSPVVGTLELDNLALVPEPCGLAFAALAAGLTQRRPRRFRR